MEASVRCLNLNRHLTQSILHRRHYALLKLPFRNKNSSLLHLSFAFPYGKNPNHVSTSLTPNDPVISVNRNHRCAPTTRIRCSSFSVPWKSSNSNPLGFLLWLYASSSSSSQNCSSLVSQEHFNRNVESNLEEKFFKWWNLAPVGEGGGGGGCDLGFSRERGPVLTVVLLGWLGAQQKHLKRYVELYASKGIQAVTFIVPVEDVLWFDLGRRVEKRISALTKELVSWLSDTGNDHGRERSLLFHTFSNTGWLAYGAILDNLQSSGNYIEKIKGCVIDSGGDPEINPKVWAAGFSAALLKKRSSATLPSVGAIERNGLETDEKTSKMQDSESPLIETMALSVLDKLFSVVLKLPDVNQRLTKIISVLSNNQPPCPQLYLYSTADRVIPSSSVEYFIQDQIKKGRKVWAHNFGSSPHVDHFRSFPSIYSSELHKFLKEVVSTDDN